MADVYELVTNRIIEELEKGNIPWRKPWAMPTISQSRENLAYSRSTGKPYSLLNQMLLGKQGEWATFKQIADEGGKVKKGEKSSVCVFWKWIENKTTDEETGEEKISRIPYLRYIQVFHIATQCEGIEPKYKPEEVSEVTEEEADLLLGNAIEQYISREHIGFENGFSDRAYYAPSLDKIVVPSKAQYTSLSEYYSTLAHETVHSTGHKSRLNRFEEQKSVAFGSEDYSKEELVAEVGSASLLNIYGIETPETFTNSTAYIGSWIKKLKNDKKFIVSACSKAEKAVKYILGQHETEEAEA